ncbi:MAG: RnfABCDGE type electron transport complex subunit B [Burkholderiales bacterium]|jgi:electron transport complex protein RnfB|nr:RnfABCDGE type electron transport complex subunit B [Burkholderiales bacterium]
MAQNDKTKRYMSHGIFSSRSFAMVAPIALDERAARLDEILPQYQCGRCDYVDCAHYAQALAQACAPPTSCAPGDIEVARALAQAMNVSLPENITFEPETLQCVVIDEADCVGCTRCLRACPLDALIGAAKKIHAVLPSLCSGCGLCLSVCPLDCMKLMSVGRQWTKQDADAARDRYRARLHRLMKQATRRIIKHDSERDEREKRRQAVFDALLKARARRLQWAQRKEDKKIP